MEDDLLYHNQNGYQSVQQFPYTDNNTEILLNPSQELGYKFVDINAETQLSVMKLQTTSANGTHRSTNSTFILIRSKRKNLSIKTEAHVTKLLVENEMNRAVGVEKLQRLQTTRLN